ncbi:YusW family protein [Halalkalibacterium ligniniphilum]|uniref:YusW family protein n=1 Tax=Halalkalibacterium ligniniphilum TaxID=1134413 RepID=UPI00034AC67C|nr:YusW family protein [Halalkalibacterium ligniniphilum]
MKKVGLFFLIFIFALPMLALANEDRETLDLTFRDTGDDYWAQEYIDRMRVKDVFQGYDDGSFRPSNNVTRLQTIVTAVRLLGLEEEALAKDPSTPVFFEDAESYFSNERNLWAKGYILVALEQGLFDTSETAINANQPASRVWVASILVRALGLEEEALQAMTTAPRFTDAKQIPAGAIGYVNIASNYGIITGKEDGRFDPNANITRAQMAAVLDRTYDGLLEEQGVTYVRGELLAHDSENRTLTVNAFDGERTFQYGEGLHILFKGRLIQPNQLQIGDQLSLSVLNNAVVEAEIVDEAVKEQLLSDEIQEFEVEAKYENDDELELEYKLRKGRVKAEVEESFDGSERELKGEEALAEITRYLEQWGLSSKMTNEEVVQRIRASLPERDDLIELKIDVKFTNGVKVKQEFKVKKKDEERGSYNGIHKLELEIKTTDNTKVEWDYEHTKDGEVEAEVEWKHKGKERELEGSEAQEEIEASLDSIEINDSMSNEELVNAFVQANDLDVAKVKEVKVKIYFDTGIERKIEWKNSFPDVKEEDDDDDDKDEERGSYNGIQKLELEIKTTEDTQVKWQYEHENDGEVDAEFKWEGKNDKRELMGTRAQEQIEAYLNSINISDSSSDEELVEAFILVNDLDRSAVTEVKVKIYFDSGIEKEVEWKNDSLQEDEDEDEDEDVNEVNRNW